MKNIIHKVIYHKQTTSVNCSQTALAMLLSFYGKNMTTDDVMQAVPRQKDESGNELGSNLIQELGTWCLQQGFEARLYTFDAAIIDLRWKGLDRKELLEAFQKARAKRSLATLTNSKNYFKAYADFVATKGELHILAAPDAKLLQELIQKGPFIAAVSNNALHGAGGTITTHAITVYGVNKAGKYMVADPHAGRVTVTVERLIAAIMAAQVEADNMILQIK